MAKPTAGQLSNISTILGIGGAASSAFGAYYDSLSTKSAYEIQAIEANTNKQLAEYQAQDAIARGQTAEAQQRIKGAQVVSAQRTHFAASGVDISPEGLVGPEGKTYTSAFNILEDTKLMTELDARTIRQNALKEAWGYRVEGANYNAQGKLLTSRAAGESPLGAGATSLLTSGSTVAANWYSRKAAGVE